MIEIFIDSGIGIKNKKYNTHNKLNYLTTVTCHMYASIVGYLLDTSHFKRAK